MAGELEFMSREVVAGRLSRRDFLGRASALGVTLASAQLLLGSAAQASGLVKGGILRAGLVGGESTNSLDPRPGQARFPIRSAAAGGSSCSKFRQRAR